MEPEILFSEIRMFGSQLSNASQRLSKSKRKRMKKKAKGFLKKVAEAVKVAPPSSPLQPDRIFGPRLEDTRITNSSDRLPVDGMSLSSPLASSNHQSSTPAQPTDVEPPRKDKVNLAASSLSSVQGGGYGLRPRKK